MLSSRVSRLWCSLHNDIHWNTAFWVGNIVLLSLRFFVFFLVRKWQKLCKIASYYVGIRWLCTHFCSSIHSHKQGLFWDAVLVHKKTPSVQYALLQHLSLSLKKPVCFQMALFWMFFFYYYIRRGCVWIMLNVRLCVFFFMRGCVLWLFFLRCWCCLS